MKKTLMILSAVCCLQLAAYADSAKYPHSPNTKDWMNDQNDQTDALSIPLDSSEEEQESELQGTSTPKPGEQKEQTDCKGGKCPARNTQTK